MNTNVIRTLTLRSTTEGVTQSAAALNSLSVAQDNVAKSAVTMATVTDVASRRQLSAADAYQRQTLRLNEAARMQDQFARASKIADQALAQGTITATEHSQRLDLLSQKYQQGSTFSKAFSQSISGVSGQLIALSAGAGPAGVFLSALGPWGLAASIGMGLLEKAFGAAAASAHALAEKSRELEQFAQQTGLTTDQVQALRNEAGKFHITSDQAATAIRNFTARFDELRNGSGALLTDIRRINPALADQMAAATNAGDALTLFGQSLQNVDNIFQRNALVKAATGRGGISSAAFLSALDVDKVTAAFVASGKALDENLLQKISQLEIDIEKASKHASANLGSIFAEPILQWEADWAKGFQKFTLAVRKLSEASKQDGLTSVLGYVFGVSAAPRSLSSAAGQSSAFVGPMIAQATQFQGPQQTTPQYDAAKQREVVAALGQAATFTEQYNAKLAELKIKAHDAGLTQDELNRAIGALNVATALEKTQALIGALGAMAPVQLKVQAAEQATFEARFKGLSITEEQSAQIKKNAEETALGTRSMQQQADAARVQAATINMSAGASTAYTLEQTRLNQALRDGQPLTDADREAIHKWAQEAGGAAQSGEALKVALQFKREGQEMFLSDIDVQIAQKLKGLYPDIATALNSTEAAAMRFQAVQKQLITDFKAGLGAGANTFVQSLEQGKSVMDSMILSARSLSQSLQTSAITELLKGNFIGAAASGIGALISGLFGSKKTSEENRAAQQAISSRISGFDIATMQAGSGASTQAGSLAIFDAQAQQARLAEQQAGGQAMVALERKLAAEREQIVADFTQKAADAELQRQQDILAQQQAVADRVQSFSDRLFAAGNDTSTIGGALAAFDRQAQQQLLVEDRAGGEARVELEAALAQERLGVIDDFNTRAAQAAQTAADQALQAQQAAADQALAAAQAAADQLAQAIAAATQRGLALSDRLFSAQHASGSQADQLAIFDRNAERERNQAIVQGDSLFLLQQVQDQERLNIIQASNAQILQATQQAAEQEAAAKKAAFQEAQNFLDGATKNIADFIAHYNAGSSSPLSPANRLAAAQSTFETQRQLALGGNRDALSGITSNFSDLADAVKAYYGSAAAGQTITGTALSQLGVLPSQVSPEQFIVDAIKDVHLALTGSGGVKAAIDDKDFTASLDLPAQTTTDIGTIASNTGATDLIRSAVDTVATNTGGISSVAANTAGTATNTFYTAAGIGTGPGTGATTLTGALGLTNAGIGTVNSNVLDVAGSAGDVAANTGSGAPSGSIADLTSQMVNLINQVHGDDQSIVNRLDSLKSNTSRFWNPRGGSSEGTVTQLDTFALGGVIPPYGLGLVSEHSPGGGRFLQAGAEPIHVFPGSPSNDNSAMLGALIEEMRYMQNELRALRAQVAKGSKDIVDAVDDVHDTTEELVQVERKGWTNDRGRAGRAA